MADYFAAFGGGSLGAKSGLNPTFISFINTSGSGIASPAITEPGSKGLYYWSYAATNTIAFILDGATTGLSASDRYVPGVIYASDNFGSTLTAIGSTLSGMGATLAGAGATIAGIGATLTGLGSFMGTTSSTFGSTSVDPSTLFGFLRRAQEFNEGNCTYIKATGILDFYSRGSSTLLSEKTVTDSATSTTKA